MQTPTYHYFILRRVDNILRFESLNAYSSLSEAQADIDRLEEFDRLALGRTNIYEILQTAAKIKWPKS